MIFKTLSRLALCISLSFTGTAFVSAMASANTSSGLDWEVQKQWQIPESPIDVAHSLDGKYVFVLTDAGKVLIYTSQGKLEGSVPVDKGVKAIDIAARAEMLYLIDSEKKSFSAISIDFVREINTKGSPFRGPENAPVNIVIFTDFECPYCKKVEPLIAEVQEKNPKTTKVVFKNMPLQFHKFADPAHRAALAAEKQGKFWEFHDALFASEKLSNKIIEDIAVKLNLDIDKWKKDMQAPDIRSRIYNDIQDAQKAGVTGTPTIYINGRLLKNRSMQGFQQMIDEELSKN